MTKEEFKKRLSELKNISRKAQNAVTNFEAEYLEKHPKLFSIGTKVKVTYKDGTKVRGIIKNYRLDVGSNIIPIVARLRKDGKPHTTQTWGVYQGDKIEKID